MSVYYIVQIQQLNNVWINTGIVGEDLGEVSIKLAEYLKTNKFKQTRILQKKLPGSFVSTGKCSRC